MVTLCQPVHCCQRNCQFPSALRGTHGDQTKAVHFDCGQLGSTNVGTDQEEDPQNTRNANKTCVTSLLSRTGTCLSRTLPKTKARTEKLRSIVTRHNVTTLERAVQENANYHVHTLCFVIAAHTVLLRPLCPIPPCNRQNSTVIDASVSSQPCTALPMQLSQRSLQYTGIHFLWSHTCNCCPYATLVSCTVRVAVCCCSPCGALWVYALPQASAQAQQNKILISGTIGACRSGKRGAAAWQCHTTSSLISSGTIQPFCALRCLSSAPRQGHSQCNIP